MCSIWRSRASARCARRPSPRAPAAKCWSRGLLEDYRRLHGEFIRATREYAQLPLDADAQEKLKAVLGREQKLMGALEKGAPVSPEEFTAFAEQARAILSTSGRLIDVEVEHLRTTALDARSTLTWQLLAAIPVALGIALWFRAVISSQLQQVDRAIRSIGRAEYSDGVTVTGPQDLAYLGRRLDWLRRRLAELEEQKNRFLRHVSHDLKTPLTAIREGAQ
ncbi:MAG: hypothetical protein DPW12_15840, partial [Rhodocyclaceae bacterium]|nr:hypothetical protein [Rhodocyclaceae bacterium]